MNSYYIIYGFTETTNGKVIDDTILTKYNIQKFNINFGFKYAYGLLCEFDDMNGTIYISKSDKELVNKALEDFTNSGNIYTETKYFVCQPDDCVSCCESYLV